MKWLYNMKIGRKLITAFIMVALIAAIVGTLGVYQLKTVTASYSALYNDYGVSLSYLSNMMDSFLRTRMGVRDMILDLNDASKLKYAEQIKGYEKDLEANIALYDKTNKSSENKEMFNKFKTAWTEYKSVRDRVMVLALNHQEGPALVLTRSDEVATISRNADQAISNLVDSNIKTGGKISEDLNDSATRTSFLMVAVALLAVVIATVLGLFISRIISKPVIKLVGVAEKIADGNLDADIEATSGDEIGMLQLAFQKMLNNTNDVMHNINDASSQVASGAKQVSGASITLAQGATEQASTVEQLSASIEEISSQTRLNADNANQANTLAKKAQTAAINGNEQMKNMLKSMSEIDNASSDISRIIKVIDDIAFQTNILALNAAVEAARAGEHGRGFAVVAEEVRNLASRSAEAAKQTTTLIEGSIKKVEDGTKIANETATALNVIVNEIESAAMLISNITVASNEQASGISQVAQGLNQVSQVVQSNSATSEESAAASEELSGQAALLKEQVNRFKLGVVNKAMNSNVPMTYEEKGEKTEKREKAKIVLTDGDYGKY